MTSFLTGPLSHSDGRLIEAQKVNNPLSASPDKDDKVDS